MHMSVDILPEALSASWKIQNDSTRVLLLSALVQFLPVEDRSKVLSEVLCTASTLYDYFRNEVRNKVLITLAPHLTADELRDALSAAQKIGDTDQRTLGLATLIPQLSAEDRSEVLVEVLNAAREIDFSSNSDFWRVLSHASIRFAGPLLACR